MTTIDSHITSHIDIDAPAIPGLTFRHAGPDDWAVISEVTNRAHRGDGIDEVISAETLAGEYSPLDHFDLARDVLIAEIDGTPVAFHVGYRVERDAGLCLETWAAVLPEHRGRGIGTALLRANQARLVAEAALDQGPGPREFRTFALDAERADTALLEAEGYVPIRFGFEMRRFLTGSLPEHALPAGLELRAVTLDQHRAIFDANEEAFRDHWGHRPAGEGDFAATFDNRDTDASLWCVAWDGDEVAGVVINAIYATENEILGVRRGWLDQVSVRRPWRGRGVAKALCAASFRVLRERGMDEAWLGVDGSNPTGAVRLYEGLGFLVARRWQAYSRSLDGPAPAGWRAAGEEPTGAVGS
jgi:mycothiol synthase